MSSQPLTLKGLRLGPLSAFTDWLTDNTWYEIPVFHSDLILEVTLQIPAGQEVPTSQEVSSESLHKVLVSYYPQTKALNTVTSLSVVNPLRQVRD